MLFGTPAPVQVLLEAALDDSCGDAAGADMGALGAKPPRRVPVWLGRVAAGQVGVSMMTQIRGASNAKARRELGWEPWFASWRAGFRHGLTDTVLPRGAAA